MPESDLAKTLDGIRSRIARSKARGLNEQNTKATLIEPVLRALSWNTEDVDEVVREYTSARRANPVDYGLLVERQPRLLLEAKPFGAALGDAKWATQFLSYALSAGVTWMVLTNGDEYRIYNTHAKVPLEEKLWRSVRVSDGGALVEQTLALLARDRLRENRIDRLWQAHFVDRKVRGALEELLASGGEGRLLRFVREHATDLSPSEIRASLRRCRASFDFPSPSADAPSDGRGVRKSQRRAPTRGGADISALIAAGLIHPPVQLSRTYKGRDLAATIETDASVTCLGKRYTSASTAGGAAMASVIGLRPDGDVPAVNGWDFWRVAAPDGKLVPLAAIRKRIGHSAVDK